MEEQGWGGSCGKVLAAACEALGSSPTTERNKTEDRQTGHWTLALDPDGGQTLRASASPLFEGSGVQTGPSCLLADRNVTRHRDVWGGWTLESEG